MIRCVARRRVISFPRPAIRGFHATTQKQRSLDPSDVMDAVLAKSHLFHHGAFQYIHDLTTLPWLVSIPLTTILMRSVFTFARAYLAHGRQQRSLATPHLYVAGKLIEKRGQLRLNAGLGSVEENEQWKRKQWEQKRDTILKDFPGARPEHERFAPILHNVDVTNPGVVALTAYNITTLLSLGVSDNPIFETGIDSLGGIALSCYVGILATLNLNYSYGKFQPSLDKEAYSRYSFTAKLFVWTPAEIKFLLQFGFPILAAYATTLSSPAVLAFLATNSTYTFLERQILCRIFYAPPFENPNIKTAVQTTR